MYLESYAAALPYLNVSKGGRMGVIEANAIGYAFAGEKCLFCDEKPNSMYAHSKTCPKKFKNQKRMEEIKRGGNRHAFHAVCGNVMILEMKDGLALIENDRARFVVPVLSLHCGGTHDVIAAIEDAKLSQTQVKEIIEYLETQAVGVL